MSYPVIESTSSGTWNGLDGEPRSMVYPSGIEVGDLILVVAACDGALSESWQFEVYGYDAGSVSGLGYLYVMAQIAEGGETGQFTQSQASNDVGAWRVYRISNWFGDLNETIASNTSEWPCPIGVECAYVLSDNTNSTGRNDSDWPDANGASGNPDSVTLTQPAGDNLWFTAFSRAPGTNATVTSAPSGWTLDHFDRGDDGSVKRELGIARKTSTNATEDPGAWTLSDTTAPWRAVTFCVRPVWKGAHVSQAEDGLLSGTSGGVSEFTLNEYLDWQQGDLMLFIYGVDGTTAPTLTNSDWTSVGGGAGGGCYLQVWARICPARALTSAEGPTWTQPSEDGAYHLLRVASGDWSGDLDDIEMSSVLNTASTTSLGQQEISPSWGAGDNLFIKVSIQDDASVQDATWNNTGAYTSWNKAFAATTPDSNDVFTFMAHQYSTASSSSTDIIATAGSSVGTADACIAIRSYPRFTVNAHIEARGADLFSCGAECGIWTESSGSLFSHIQQETGTVTLETTVVRSGDNAFKYSSGGSYSFHVNAAGNSILHDGIGDSFAYELHRRVGYFRGYFRFPDPAPTVTTVLVAWEGYNSSAADGGISISASDGKMRAFIQREGGDTLNSDPVDVPTDEWIGIEVLYDTTANPQKIHWRTWTAATEWSSVDTLSYQVGRRSDWELIYRGILIDPDDASWVVYMDDIVWGFLDTVHPDAWDPNTPHGGEVKVYTPPSDGTHSFTTGEFQDDAANNLAPTDTDIYTHVGDITDTAEHVRDATAGSTDYVTFGLVNEATETRSPRGVTVLYRYGGSSVYTNEEEDLLALSPDGTTFYLYTYGSMNASTYFEPYHTPFSYRWDDGLKWDRASLNEMQFRMYGADTVAYSLAGLAVEVDWVDPVPALAYIVPDEDLAATGWSTAPLWSKVDEDYDSPDGTTISSSVT